jgi:hypothetical protein
MFKKNIKILSFLLLILFNHAHGEENPDKKIFRFDAGSVNSPLFENSTKLTRENLYNESLGFGWIIPPEYEFEREILKNARSPFLIDGVTGKNISFKLKAAEGDWHFTVWIESGTEDSSTTVIKINGIEQEKNWQIFNPPAEPRTSIQKAYRIFNREINLADNEFNLSIESAEDSIRLLGFSLIPAVKNPDEKSQKIFEEIKSARTIQSGINLGQIKNKLEDILERIPSDPFVNYWDQQIELMMEGEKMIELAGWEWATQQTRMGIFDRFHQGVMIFDSFLNDDNILYDRALWNRARLLYWLNLERGGIYEEEGSRRDVSELYEKYPDNLLIAMYSGEKIDTPDPCDSIRISSNAPDWSKLQLEALCRMRQEIYWWVNVKQAPNGELGGKIGDDVEILRGWTPVILAGDTTALFGWKRLADCAWYSPKVYKGYSKDPNDVEHAAEFISDSTPELVFFTDDDLYLQRLKFSADYFKDFWTGISDNGRRYFRSAWFSSTEIDSDPPKNRDVEMNTRAVKAVRYYAWKTGDEELIKYLHDWSRAWVASSLQNDKNKPIGIIPASISFPSAEINGEEENWYEANMFWSYFNWQHSAGTKMLDQLLFTYLLTDDAELLQPLFLSLSLIIKYEQEKKNQYKNAEIIKGSEQWAAGILRSKKEFWNTVEQYRFLTGDKKYDNLILKYGTPYSKYRLSKNEKFIEESLTDLLEVVRYNIPLRTTEVLHTDRVYYPGSDYLKAMLTGDGTSEGSSPYHAVSWENTGSDFTALVDETGQDKLSVQIFSHSSVSSNPTMRVWQLAQGKYELKISDGISLDEKRIITVENRGERILLDISPNKLIKVDLRHAQD